MTTPLSAEELAELNGHYKGVPVNNPLVRALATITELQAALDNEINQRELSDDICNNWKQRATLSLARAEAAEARVKELEAACTPSRTYSGSAPTVTEQRCLRCHQSVYNGELLVHAPDCPIRSASEVTK